jgi:hypothetical protein
MRFRSVIAALLALSVFAPAALAADPPEGVSGMARSARVDLAWTAVSGATSYRIYRGTSASNINTALTPSGVTGTSYSDTTAANGTTYYYAVRSRSGTTESGNSLVVQSTPKAASCSSGNATRVENCSPGDTTWRLTNFQSPYSGGLEAFATAQSVDGGQTLDVKVNADWGTSIRAEVYRQGYYGGAGGRLMGTIRDIDTTRQDSCGYTATTGLAECSNWDVTFRVPTTTGWPSGVYLLRLVRTDTGADTHVLFVVRDDDRASQVLYGLPFTTYQAYNDWGGKSTYDWNSSGANTVAGTPRAVSVSFDRPYGQVGNPYVHDWWSRTDYQTVFWLERMGYDVAYVSNTDLERTPALASQHPVYIAGAHDEYWSAAMRTALESARGAGKSLLFSGSNDVYWKVRFQASPTGALDRIMTVYKTTQSGPADPSGIPTGTWRDPAGANKPENGLVGQQYVGDNDTQYFPLTVPAAEGSNRIWRYTGLDHQPDGTFTQIGSSIVGWEWNARVANGQEPAGVVSWTASPVTGALIQNNGAFTTPGTATAGSTKYTAASGAQVVNTGTNFWGRGLALDTDGNGEPDLRIQQATTNILLDMGATPSTPHTGIVVSTNWPPSVSSTNPADGASMPGRTLPTTATFNRPMDATSITTSTFTLTGPGGAAVPATVTYNATTRTATLQPQSALAKQTAYTARLTTGVKASDGSTLGAAVQWTFTTVSCPCNVYGSAVPAQTGLDAQDGRWGGGPYSLELGAKYVVDAPTFLTGLRFYKSPGEFGDHVAKLWNASGTQLASVAFTNETASGWQQQALPAPITLQPGQTYVVSVNANNKYVFTGAGLAGAKAAGSVRTVVGNNGVYGLTGGEFPTNSYNNSDYSVDVQFIPGGDPLPVNVASTSPAAGYNGATLTTTVRATFTRDVQASAVNASTFTLTGPGGTPVAATVSYDAGTKTATLTPSAPLTGATQYTARLDGSIGSSDGETLGTAYTWSFGTDGCPCQLFADSTAPQYGGNPTYDGRWQQQQPWTYELGVKVTVDRDAEITAIRYYREPGETGTHVGRVWSSTGTLIASVTFGSETASGWQTQALPTPLGISADTTYVISVNRNDYYGFTPAGLMTSVSSGPLHTVVGSNGVYGLAAGDFPSFSYNSSNYFTDVVIR